MEELNITFDNIDINPIETEIDTPMIVQTDGLSIEDSLAFVKDCAEGKRKVARAVRNKYEGTKGEASEITEYSTFDELSDKISQIPVEVPMGSAMEQNGGVLPFFDVYNETLKAMKEFAGYGFNGVCAFELDKWSYDNDHTITLSGASAYYTSDKGELITTDTDYRFKDIDQPNTNRFIVFFYKIEEGDKYSVPTYLPATSVLNLWCIKGTPLISFNGNYTALNSINVYDGELIVNSDADCKLGGLTNVRKFHLPHIKEINGGSGLFYTAPSSLKVLSLPNLKRIDTGLTQSFLRDNYSLKEMNFPELEYVGIRANVYFFNRAEGFQKMSFPKLKEIRNSSTSQSAFIYYSHNISLLEFPALEKTNKILENVALKQGCKLVLGKPKGGDITIGGNSYLANITVEKGFASRLSISGCNNLSIEVLVGIIDNLADLRGETSLNLKMGSTLLEKLTDADKAIATQKNWTLS